ncbi:MAG: HNH endonuclease domain-containing protein [Campylobacterota bacterium]|nr:HNH endonuclease domain-containing protein [Campylobacterota bacterium]
MIKIVRANAPTFLNYNDDIVKEHLKKDFHKKCYLCEEVTRHFEVDHFYPQKYYPHLINEYDNLFYCCQKCNKIKPKKINIDSNSEILNCCEVDLEAYIKLKLNLNQCLIEVEKISTTPQLDSQVNNTIELLDRIYNGTDSKSNACEDLRDEIIQNIANFRKKIDKYYTTKLKRAITQEIKEELSKSSSYSTFKRWIIKDDSKYKTQFEQYIID